MNLILSSVNTDSSSMGQDHIMGHNERLFLWIPTTTIPKWAWAMRWWINPWPVATNRYYIGLIESGPILNPVPEEAETYICVVFEILPENKYFLLHIRAVDSHMKYGVDRLKLFWDYLRAYCHLLHFGTQPSSISFFKFLRNVIVGQRHEGLDPWSQRNEISNK